MSINVIDDIVKTLNTLKNDPQLENYIDEMYSCDFNLNVINHNQIEDDDLRENVDEIELSASHFLLDNSGLINKVNESKLNKHGFKIIKLDEEFEPMSHSIVCDKFNILFANY